MGPAAQTGRFTCIRSVPRGAAGQITKVELLLHTLITSCHSDTHARFYTHTHKQPMSVYIKAICFFFPSETDNKKQVISFSC